jgi:hypothetical protein
MVSQKFGDGSLQGFTLQWLCLVVSAGMISTQKAQLYNRDTTGTVVENA